jgi:Tfp pilus assembly protein PilP
MTIENPIVAEKALIPDALAMHKLALIGLMHAGENGSALIRTPRGDIVKVTVGDQVGNKTVAAISDDALILVAGNGAQTILQMPA